MLPFGEGRKPVLPVAERLRGIEHAAHYFSTDQMRGSRGKRTRDRGCIDCRMPRDVANIDAVGVACGRRF
jgi:hypothetical protein